MLRSRRDTRPTIKTSPAISGVFFIKIYLSNTLNAVKESVIIPVSQNNFGSGCRSPLKASETDEVSNIGWRVAKYQIRHTIPLYSF